MEFTINIDDDLIKRFELALQLTGESGKNVVESMLKAYVVQAFSGASMQYQSEMKESARDTNYGKAISKIPKWASKPMSVPSKIIRAYLNLSQNNMPVKYSELLMRCSDNINYPDEFVHTFANNFAQMKIDSEKSHGKVFEVNSNNIVTIWHHVRETIIMNETKFKNYSTMTGFTNQNNQTNLGRTDNKGTDHGQWLYAMRCENCLHEYYANGSDIHLKKCPLCQGGADTKRSFSQDK